MSERCQGGMKLKARACPLCGATDSDTCGVLSGAIEPFAHVERLEEALSGLLAASDPFRPERDTDAELSARSAAVQALGR